MLNINKYITVGPYINIQNLWRKTPPPPSINSNKRRRRSCWVRTWLTPERRLAVGHFHQLLSNENKLRISMFVRTDILYIKDREYVIRCAKRGNAVLCFATCAEITIVYTRGQWVLTGRKYFIKEGAVIVFSGVWCCSFPLGNVTRKPCSLCFARKQALQMKAEKRIMLISIQGFTMADVSSWLWVLSLI